MITTLNTIPIDQDFMYQRQGYDQNHIAGSPIGNFSKLLPFLSKPFNIIPGAEVSGILKCINGMTVGDIGPLTSIERNNKIQFYWSATDDSMLTNIPAGYYYVECSYYAPSKAAIDYENRVIADGGTVEALDCVERIIDDLADISQSGLLFKTEIFYIDHSYKEPVRQGSFNQSFSEAFDV